MQCHITKNFDKERKLITEIRRPGREVLYDIRQKEYKNNFLKQIIWNEISGVMGMQKIECQILWKTLRQKYKLAMAALQAKGGNGKKKLKPLTKILVTEMKFLEKYLDDINQITNSSKDVSRQQLKHKEEVEDPETSSEMETSTQTNVSMKRSKLSEAEEDFRNSCLKLEQMSDFLSNQSAQGDPFFQSLEKEFDKVPEAKKSVVRLKLFQTVIEAQETVVQLD